MDYKTVKSIHTSGFGNMNIFHIFSLPMKESSSIKNLDKLLIYWTFLQVWEVWSKVTRNATRCNNRDDLLHLRFTLKISKFSETYV